MFNKFIKKFQYGDLEVTLETGMLARQATSSVLVSIGDTMVLVTVVAKKDVKEGQDFFPLTVDYFEKNYAVGKIPGGFFKRETKPSDNEVLIARLIDRSLRPLFPAGFYNEIHVVAQVISLDPEISPDIPAFIGAVSAISLSGVPFNAPVGMARVAYINGEFVLNPRRNIVDVTSQEQSISSSLDLVVAGTKQAVLMVESEALELSEEIMLNAIMFGHEKMQVVIDAISEFVAEVNPVMWDFSPVAIDEELLHKIKELVESDLRLAYNVRQKSVRVTKIENAYKKLSSALITETTDLAVINKINEYFHGIESNIVRSKILRGEPRIDGRNTRAVRNIDISTQFLKRAHGSAIFTRGETQSLSVVTLGTQNEAQTIDAIAGNYTDRFMLHYNFPPFATGEAGRIGAPKRREIGHGNLAKRALKAVLPSADVFPYSIRVVSEILESNGSSSMATVCGGSLCMMDAGVPLKNHVAGVAMGLILDGNKFAVLTDILGDEDHLGDMDFKVAGTENGITALQMDIKIEGITRPIMHVALKQALEARMHILGLMKQALEYPRVLSDRVPSLHRMQISVDKIKDVIGKGGSVIKSIIANTGATVDISEDGLITIACSKKDGVAKAILMIESIVIDAKIGEVYDGVVTRILERNMGVMVSIMGGKEGFVHVSQIANERVEDVRRYVKEGQTVKVKLLEFDDRGRMRLSIKALLDPVVKTEVKEDNQTTQTQ